MDVDIRVQSDDFDLGQEVAALRGGDLQVGAVATFTGVVREMNDDASVQALTLEHYPGMTEKALADIALAARSRWAVRKITIVHRVGTLEPGDNIVFVGVTSAHRGDAFAACEFLMDYLKTKAPFWKKERTLTGERWVDARSSDDAAAARWGESGEVASDASATGSGKLAADP